MNKAPSPFLRAVEAGRPQDSYPQIYGPPTYDPDIGVVLISRYKDAEAVLKDPKNFSSAATLAPVRYQPTPEVIAIVMKAFGGPHIATTDGEEHRRVRAVAARAFPNTTQHVAPLMPAVLDMFISDVQREMRTGEAELVEHLIDPLTFEIARRTIGLPDDAADIRVATKRQGELLWGNPGPEAQLARAQGMLALAEYCSEAVEAVAEIAASERPDTYIARLLDQDIPLDEVKLHVYTAISAGYSTTTYAFGNIIEDNLQREGTWRQLHDHPDEIPEAVAQGLEKSTSVHGWLRQVSADADDATVGGVRLEPGARLLVLLGAANQDPERPNNTPDLTFSTHPHRCLGAAQSQFVLEQALARLTAEFPAMSLARPALRYADLAFNGPDKLWVRLEATA